MESPGLPIVSRDTTRSVTGELRGDFIGDTLDRITNEQPELAKRMIGYIAARAQDDEQVTRMVETFVLTFRLLESQADADAMNRRFGADGTES